MASGLLLGAMAGLAPMCAAPAPPTPQQMVKLADVIVVVAAPDDYYAYPTIPDRRSTGEVEFRVVRTLKGEDPGSIVLRATLVDEDEFNHGTVPYRGVRRSGEAGCVATKFRRGGHYLFIMRHIEGQTTPYWTANGPTNEQLQPVYRLDPWFKWVRNRVRRNGEGEPES